MIVGPFDNPAGLAVCAAALYPFLICELTREKKGKWRWVMGCLIALNILTVFLSQSRTGIVALTVVSGYMRTLRRLGKTAAPMAENDNCQFDTHCADDFLLRQY